MDDYLKDPAEIERRSFALIRQLTELNGFNELEQQVVMRLVHTCGNPEITPTIRFSKNAVTSGVAALNDGGKILCDVEMVKQGLTKRYLESEPLCYLNHPEVAEKAKNSNHSRSMTALQYWIPQLDNSIAIIGNAPTALFRLMELIEQGYGKPALVIGIPVGFVGASESKSYLFDNHQSLGIECITILGQTGGSALAAGVFNTLVRLKRGLRF